MDSSKVKSSKLKSKSKNQIEAEKIVSNWFSAAKSGNTGEIGQIASSLRSDILETFFHKRNRSGQTALMVAAQNGHIETVEFLCEEIDQFENEKTNTEISLLETDNLGRTALMLAAEFGHIGVVTTLLNLPYVEPEEVLAILNVKNKSGKDALAIAQKRNHPHMAQFLFTYFNETKAAIENKNGSNKETEEEFNYFMMPLPASPRVKLGLPMSINNPVIFRDMPALALYPSAPIANTPEKDETEVIIRNFMGLRL